MRFLIVVLTALLFSCIPVERNLDSKDITVVINPWFPYELWDSETKTIKGATGEYVNLLFKELGYDVSYVVEPSFDRALIMVATEKVDSIYSLLQTPERTKIMLFSETDIIEYESLFLINASVNPSLVGTSIYDFKGKLTFGSVVGETESEYSIPRRSNFTFIRTFRSYQELMESLDKGIIDVALMEKFNGIFEYNVYASKNNSFRLAATSDYTSQFLKIAFAPNEFGAKLKREFDEINATYKESGLLEELLTKYVGDLPTIEGLN